MASASPISKQQQRSSFQGKNSATFQRAVEVLRKFCLDQSATAAVQKVLVELCSTEFSKHLDELGYDVHAKLGTFQPTVMFVRAVITELSMSHHQALVNLTAARDSIDGHVFSELVLAGFMMLARAKSELNKINVFPVPDGDTGTNMYNCLKEPSHALFLEPDVDVRKASSRLADEVVTHGQGNSGTILAYFFIALASAFKDANTASVTTAQFAAAVGVAGDAVKQAVSNPKEGTMVSVMRDASKFAAASPEAKGTDLRAFVETWAKLAMKEVEDTPNKLIDDNGKYILKEAGVVDSGAKGFAYVLEGMASALAGTFKDYTDSPTKFWLNEHPQAPTDAVRNESYDAAPKFRFCTEVVIPVAGLTKDAVEAAFKKEIASASPLGDSMVCIAASSDKGTLAKVHIHSDEPGRVFDLARTLALPGQPLTKMKVNDMVQQVHDEKTEMFDAKKMDAASVRIFTDACYLPYRVMKHCTLCPVWILSNDIPLRLGETHTYEINALCNQARLNPKPLETGAPLPLQVKRKLEASLLANPKQDIVTVTIAAAASALHRNVVTAKSMLPADLQKRLHVYNTSPECASTGYLGPNALMALEAMRAIESGADTEAVMKRLRFVDDRIFTVGFYTSESVNRLAKWRSKLFWWIPYLAKKIMTGSGTVEDPHGVESGLALSLGTSPQHVPIGFRDTKTKLMNMFRLLDYKPIAEMPQLQLSELKRIQAHLKPGAVVRDFMVLTPIRIDVAVKFCELAKANLPCKEDPVVLEPTLVAAALLGELDIMALFWVDDSACSKEEEEKPATNVTA